jgi:tetratricopeptide (TPR) repeat protein
MDHLRRRGLHIAAALILLVALGATAYPVSFVESLEAAATAILAGRADLALPALTDAIALEPDVRDLHLRAAEGALTADELDQASEFLNQLPGNDPLIECLQLDASLRAGMIEAALAQLPGTICPEQTAMLYQEADLLIEGSQYAEAIKLLESLLNSVPVTSDASQKLGTLIALHDPEAALSHLRLAVDLDRRAASFANELIEVIETARRDENPAFTLAQIGQTLARTGNWPMAATAFQNALLQDPEYTEARAYYGLALDRSGQDGLPQLELAVSQAPQALMPRMLLGKHWLIRGEPKRAIEVYEQAVALAPEDPLLAIDLGAAYAAAGDLPSAKLAYQYAIDLAPDDPNLWSLLAQFSLDYEIELDEIGLPAARQAVMLQSRNAAALDRLGYTHFLLGNRALAERFLVEAIQTDGNLASAHYHLGLMRLSDGDLVGGRAALVVAVALDPEGRFGSLAQRSLENLNE